MVHICYLLDKLVSKFILVKVDILGQKNVNFSYFLMLKSILVFIKKKKLTQHRQDCLD